MSDKQLLATASTAILASKHYLHPTDEWEARLQEQKRACLESVLPRHPTGPQATTLDLCQTPTHYFNANATEFFDDASADPTFVKLNMFLDNLLAATTSNHSTLQQLMDTNASLSAKVAALTASLASLTPAYTILVSSKCPNTTPLASTSCQPIQLDLNSYCWTHDDCIIVGNSSATCTH